MKNNEIDKAKKIKNVRMKKKLLNSSYNYFKNSNISISNNGSISAKNTLYINKLKKIDYSEYFKMNIQKSESNAKNKNIYLNNFKNYTIQPNNYFTNKSSPKKITSYITKNLLKGKFPLDLNSIKNTENTLYNPTELNNLFSNKNIYNTVSNNKNNLYTESTNINIIDDEIDDYNIKKVYKNTGAIINNNINNNMNKIKKEEELSKLKDILKKIKNKNKAIQTELNLLRNINTKLENNQNINKKNRLIYLDIKELLNKNKAKINKNNSQMDISELLQFYKFKFESSSSLRENIEYLRKVYLDEKLKNSLIEKGHKLFLENILIEDINNNSISDNENSVSDINMDDFWKYLIKIMGDIEKIKKFNGEMENKINNKKGEKNIYKVHFEKWAKILGVNNKEDLKNKIVDLINDQNYNDIEEVKLYKILMNKKP
jgi:hypothetical protein